MSNATNSNPYAPPGFSETDLFNERTWLQGAILTGVAYGVQATLFFITFYLLYRQLNRATYMRQVPFLVYITTQFLMGTFFMAALARFTQLSFIDDRNFPGGPSAYETVMFSIPIDMLGNVAYSIANWLADGLMVWRCWVIFRGSRIPTWATMLLPCLIYIGSLVTGSLFLRQNAIPTSSPFSSLGTNWTFPYFSLSLALNIIVTLMIVGRLLWYRQRIRNLLGPSHGSHYTSVASMIIESAAMYSLFTLLFLIFFGLNHPLENILLQVLSQIQIIAPVLIIFRVAQGKAWSSETTTKVFTTVPASSSRAVGGMEGGFAMTKIEFSKNSELDVHAKANSKGTVTVNKQVVVETSKETICV